MPAPRPAPRPKKLKPGPTPRLEKPLCTTKDYKTKKIVGAFYDEYIKYKSQWDEQISIKEGIP